MIPDELFALTEDNEGFCTPYGHCTPYGLMNITLYKENGMFFVLALSYNNNHEVSEQLLFNANSAVFQLYRVNFQLDDDEVRFVLAAEP